jgi:hypothetical protein
MDSATDGRFRALICSIITQAVEDIRIWGDQDAEYITADKFFKSQWFIDLALETGVHPDKVIKAVDEIKIRRNPEYHHRYGRKIIKCAQ